MDWLNYHHLLYFWTVAKEGSLRRASERLRVSQPSISTQIRQLEHSLGTDLFERRGRSLVLTEMGHFVLGYAEEIFSLGSELLGAVRQNAPARRRALHLAIGVEDSFPKLLSYQILKPVMGLTPPVQLTCREGKPEELLTQLATHRLDAVLMDDPATGMVKFKVFSHLLGSSTVALCAAPKLARRLRDGFPQSLHEAPALLPTPNTTLRRALEAWFQSNRLRPRVVAEFEDGALMKIAATDGAGFIAVPALTLDECVSRFGLEELGVATGCQDQFYLITGERRLTHPAVVLLREHARSLVFA